MLASNNNNNNDNNNSSPAQPLLVGPGTRHGPNMSARVGVGVGVAGGTGVLQLRVLQVPTTEAGECTNVLPCCCTVGSCRQRRYS